jgi:hypothetical protein
LDRRPGIGKRSADRINDADETRGAGDGSAQLVTRKMRGQHDQNADKSDDDRRPALHAHALIQSERGKGNSEQG